MVVMFPHRFAVLSLLVAGVMTLAGCGAQADSPSAASGGDARLHLVASFYPLQWAAEQVAGAGVDVGSLTKPGAEPHDLELTPQDVATVSDADLMVYLKGFQPAVDDAVSQEAGGRGFDVSKAADLNLTYTPIEEGQQHTDEAGATDPHFWLDPLRLAAVGDALAARLGTLDPTHASRYEANAAALRAKLEALDREYKAGLTDCANPDLVTSHNAFGYLAQRYGLTQVGITGLTPDDEPKPGDLAGIARFVQTNRVRTIYYETLVSPAIAKTVAAETGAQTEVLDPIEGLTRDSQGADYLQVMRANLANIRKGQPCP
jgi:zinc transport system substrate-binding protein